MQKLSINFESDCVFELMFLVCYIHTEFVWKLFYHYYFSMPHTINLMEHVTMNIVKDMYNDKIGVADISLMNLFILSSHDW